MVCGVSWLANAGTSGATARVVVMTAAAAVASSLRHVLPLTRRLAGFSKAQEP